MIDTSPPRPLVPVLHVPRTPPTPATRPVARVRQVLWVSLAAASFAACGFALSAMPVG
jgi:hypothetical protein